MKRFRKIYLEISNLCNLNCAFCPGTQRPGKRMSEAEFAALLPKLRPWTDYLYFHLMGEPLSHPSLAQFLSLAGGQGFRVILTTNGTLLKEQEKNLLTAPALHKINISLHAFEANDIPMSFHQYLEQCFSFGQSAQGNVLTVYRLWNQGGADMLNQEILDTMAAFFPKPWQTERRGTRIGDRVYLEYGEKFDWPSMSAAAHSGKIACYGLRDQIGVLCDGTVVPCCLDHDGELALGNLFQESLEEILEKPRAKAIYSGFQNKTAAEELCRRCGYARRFE